MDIQNSPLAKTWQWFINKIIPCQCLICKRVSQDIVCKDCQDEMACGSPACYQCGERIPETMRKTKSVNKLICGRCITAPPPYKQTSFAFQYTGHITTLIQRFKFKQDLLLADYLANCILLTLQKQSPTAIHFSAIIPIPLHSERLKQRGFNQAYELAKVIGKRLDVPVYKDYLLRIRPTLPQTGLNKTARLKNIKGVFKININSKYADLFSTAKKINNHKHIMLIDDVITTGATTREAASQFQITCQDKLIIVAVAKTQQHLVAYKLVSH